MLLSTPLTKLDDVTHRLGRVDQLDDVVYCNTQCYDGEEERTRPVISRSNTYDTVTVGA